jgi:hypothetical protein
LQQRTRPEQSTHLQQASESVRSVHRLLRSSSRSISTSTGRSVRSSSQSMSGSPNARVLGFPQYGPITSTRSKCGSMRMWSSSARGVGPNSSRRSRSRRSSSSVRTSRRLRRPGDVHGLICRHFAVSRRGTASQKSPTTPHYSPMFWCSATQRCPKKRSPAHRCAAASERG